MSTRTNHETHKAGKAPRHTNHAGPIPGKEAHDMTNTTTTTPSTRMQAEHHDAAGRPIYHVLSTGELDRLGVTTTLCGRLFFRDTTDLIGKPSHYRGRSICPMCALEYERRFKRSIPC